MLSADVVNDLAAAWRPKPHGHMHRAVDQSPVQSTHGRGQTIRRGPTGGRHFGDEDVAECGEARRDVVV